MQIDPHISRISDQQLLLNYRLDGKSAWMGELYHRYRHLLFGVCLKYLKDSEEARDALMAVFESLLGDMKTREVDHFPSWAYAVAKNHCLMALRKRSGQIARMEVYRNHAMGNASEDALGIQVDEIAEAGLEKLEQAIQDLSPDQRQCIRQFYIEEKSYKEIAEQTGFAINEVKSHIQNGRRNLKIKLTATA